MIGVVKVGSEQLEVKAGEKLVETVDVTEQLSSSRLGSQVVETKRKIHKAMYFACSFYDVHLRVLVNEHKHIYGQYLLDSPYLVIIDPEYSVQSIGEDADSHYDISTSETMADTPMICTDMMRPKPQGHLFLSQVQFGPWYKMMLKERKEKESDYDEGEHSAIKEVERRQKVVFEVEGVTLH